MFRTYRRPNTVESNDGDYLVDGGGEQRFRELSVVGQCYTEQYENFPCLFVGERVLCDMRTPIRLKGELYKSVGETSYMVQNGGQEHGAET